jgi:hypothetical protein
MRIPQRELVHPLHRWAAAALAGAVALVACAFAVPALAASSTWHGALDTSPSSTLSFNYSGSHITNFSIPSIVCASGSIADHTEMIYVPSIAVSGGRFSTTYVVAKARKGLNPEITIKVSGTISASQASGSVHGQGACDTDPQPFHANLGVFKPVAPPAPKAGSCTMASCLASNGMLIKVTGVNRTIKSVIGQPDSIPADPAYQNGGVAVAITEIDRSYKGGPIFVVPAYDFQLRLGSGILSPGGGPDGAAVDGSGAAFPCNLGNSLKPTDVATLTVGAHFGPVEVCFGAPTAADRQHLTLYYMRGGDVLAKIPLG